MEVANNTQATNDTTGLITIGIIAVIVIIVVVAAIIILRRRNK